jgi:alanine dehydrogenase
MVRVLTSRDLEGNVSFLEIVDAVEAGYRATGEGELVARPRNYLAAPGLHTTLSVSPAISGELGVGVFAYTGGNKGKGLPQKLAVLFDPADGGLACLIESDWLSWARTGASSAVATRYLARPDASVVGIVGAGKQARSQLLAIAASRPIERAVVYSPREERRERYAAEMTASCGFPVTAVDDVAAVLAVSDIVCTATTSREPVFDGRALRPGTHVNAIGQHYPDRRELDTEAIRRSHVVVDEIESAFIDYGELCIPLSRGEIAPDDVQGSLAEVVAGTRSGRPSPDAITIFLSGGIAGEYLAATSAVWRIAQARGLGVEIDFGPA